MQLGPPPDKYSPNRDTESVLPKEAAAVGRVEERDPLFDAMKGFGIVLVVMGHALQGSSPQYDENFAFRMIYSFHMPFFFFISGYILQVSLQGKELHPVAFVLKKARTLALPFLSWYLIFGLWRGIPSDITFSEYVYRFVRDPVYGYWFLWTLFLCFLAILPLAWLQQRIPARWRPGLIALSCFTLYQLRCLKQVGYGLDLLKIHYFYFAVGFFICYWRKQLSFLKNWWPEICIVGFLLLLPYWRRVGEMPFQPFLKEHFPRKTPTLTDVFDYSLALFGIGTAAQLVKFLVTGPAGRWLVWIGLYTFDIYVIHFWTFVLVPFGLIFQSARGDTFMILVNLAWGVCASLAISFLVIRRSSLLQFLFLGILDARRRTPIRAVSYDAIV
jgi:fucose 4-O-acetylase-like acetyltransferase